GEPYYASWEPVEEVRSQKSEVSNLPGAAVLCLGSSTARSCLAVPLRANDRTVGILHCVCDRSGGFPADFVQLVYLVADLLAPSAAFRPAPGPYAPGASVRPWTSTPWRRRGSS